MAFKSRFYDLKNTINITEKGIIMNMKFGNASWGFRETPLAEQLRITKGMGLEFLELGIANSRKDIKLDATLQELDDVKDMYKKYGITLSHAATGNDFTRGSREDLEKVKEVIDECEYLGIKYLRVFAGFAALEDVKGARWDTMIKYLTEAASYAEHRKLFTCFETHGGVKTDKEGTKHYVSTSVDPTALQKIIDETPENVRILFDPANFYAVGEKEPWRIYETIKQRVSVVHLKDFLILDNGYVKPAACGDSDMNWKRLLDSLSDFVGVGFFEYENTKEIEAGLRRSFEYIRSIEGQV